MKIEQYFNECKLIHLELRHIAERTKNMALTKCANSSNLEWNNIMDHQDELLHKLAELDNQQLE